MQTCKDCAYEAFGTAEMISHRRAHKAGRVAEWDIAQEAVTERNERPGPVTLRNDTSTTVTTRNADYWHVEMPDEIPCDCGCGVMLKRRPQYVDVSHRMKAKRERDAT